MVLLLPFAAELLLFHIDLYVLFLRVVFVIFVWLVGSDELSALTTVMLVVLERFRVEDTRGAAPEEEYAH